MSLDFTKLIDSANQAQEVSQQIVEGKYGKNNIAARKHLQVVQTEAMRLKKAITQMVTKKK